MSTAAKTVYIDLGTQGTPEFQTEHTTDCPGDSFVNRFDISVLSSSGKEYPFGLQVYCSDGSPAKPMRYSAVPDSGISNDDIKQVQGPAVASGIDDLAVRYSKDGLWISQIGYAGITVPSTIGQGNRNDLVWRQSTLEETGVGSGCKLKGLQMWTADGWIDRLRLSFACPISAQPTASTSRANDSLVPTPVSQSGTFNTQSIPTTTTLTIGSGAQLTTFVTVATPGVPLPPITLTLPGGTPVIVTQLPGSVVLSTILATRDAPAGPSGPSDGLLIALIIALSLLSAALAALLMYIRMRVNNKPPTKKQPPLPMELADMQSPSPVTVPLDAPWAPMGDVDPPAYLVVAIPEAGPVDNVPQDLVGTERRRMPDKKSGEDGADPVEDEDLYLPCTSSLALKR
ncbi:hypothetical protein BCR44DRAFT_48719 [Catenaria anguillulae PL171]|uniref:Uncharacterized protein n=1 Tax=Catenaria anguillulae PL171 TaxID=765915 RepID=A0A1Y2HPF3_9FUNG|nr:hypothetical protein BCR44DRAFT_48719 [Catenaria anguillulae PL171]